MFMSVRALCIRAFAAITHRTPNLSVRAQAFASSTVADTMNKVQLGNSDLQVSVACLGTMVRAPFQHDCWLVFMVPSFSLHVQRLTKIIVFKDVFQKLVKCVIVMGSHWPHVVQ